MKLQESNGNGNGGQGSPHERPLGQALDFLRVLWAINHGLATTSRYMKSKHGVTGRQRLIVQVVVRESTSTSPDCSAVKRSLAVSGL